MQWAAERLKQAKSVAAGCHRLPIGAHGKEGVDGSSPSEVFPKYLQMEISCAWIANGCHARVLADIADVRTSFARQPRNGLTKLF
jgi:hypothetical protein